MLKDTGEESEINRLNHLVLYWDQPFCASI